MPNKIYSIQTRGYNMGGNVRCASKEEAEKIYGVLLDAVTNDKPIVELEIGDVKTCFRAKDLTGFGLSVHLEETAEERKARAIERIERDSGYEGQNACYPETAAVGKLGYAGGGLI